MLFSVIISDVLLGITNGTCVGPYIGHCDRLIIQYGLPRDPHVYDWSLQTRDWTIIELMSSSCNGHDRCHGLTLTFVRLGVR